MEITLISILNAKYVGDCWIMEAESFMQSAKAMLKVARLCSSRFIKSAIRDSV